MDISEYDDVIDSRDVIARIAELRDEIKDPNENDRDDLVTDEEFAEAVAELRTELDSLLALASQGEDYCEDWQYGEALVRDCYFVEYAQELAEDIGAIASDAGWPYTCVDWEQAAHELQMDYTALEFRGVTYWAR